MPDEATTYYRDLITNGELGMKFLENEFGECGRPLVAWQIDPFGHSKGVAKLYRNMGFDALFLGRIDYLDYKNRTEHKEMEFEWILTDGDSEPEKILTLINSNVYWPPPKMCYDVYCDDPVIQDDPSKPGYNVEQVVRDFLIWVKSQHSGYKTNNFLVTMGNDFNYAWADKWFRNLDKLINYVRLHHSDEVNIFYSNPACYSYSVRNWFEEAVTNHSEPSSEISLPIYNKDFFPYADFPHAYWTGYFTSKQHIKTAVSIASSILEVCQHFELSNLSKCDKLKKAVAVAQHHDGISGTSKEFVTQDYITRLQDGVNDSGVVSYDLTKSRDYNGWIGYDSGQVGGNTGGDEDKSVILYNSLGWLRREELDFNGIGRVVVEIDSLSTLKISFIETGEGFTLKTRGSGRAFIANESTTRKTLIEQSSRSLENDGQVYDEDISLGLVEQNDGFIQVIFSDKDNNVGNRHKSDANELSRQSKTNGYVMETAAGDGMADQANEPTQEDKKIETEPLVNHSNDLTFYKIGAQWLLYDSHPGNDSSNQAFRKQSSGAYIFRPLHQAPKPLKNPELQNIVYRSEFKKINGHIEFFYDVNELPVDFDTEIGSELILRFKMPTGGYQFFTDATNAGFLRRERVFRPLEPTASGFYPVTSQVYLQSSNSAENTPGCFELTFDRSIGVASLTDDTIDIMINRRCLKDDFRGVAEPLNQTNTVSGRIVIKLRPDICKNTGNSLDRSVLDKLIRSNPLIAVSHEIDKSILSKPFPYEIHLLSLKKEGRFEILIRLENLVEQSFELDISEYLTGISLWNIERLTLAGTKLNKLSFQSARVVFKPFEILTLKLSFH